MKRGSLSIIIGGALVLGFILLARVVPHVQPGLPPNPPGLALPVSSPTSAAPQAPATVVATNLEVPWALAFAPDGTLYVTERPGRLARIRGGRVERVADIPEVTQTAEGGLLGLALDAGFPDNHFLYLYYSYQVTEGGTLNRVVRYRLAGTGLVEATVLLDAVPGARYHDGGRLAFGPDGTLYVTTGDATRPELAQRLNSLAGKILRIRPDGSIPPDNPFPNSPVYSFGHRNPQGLAWTADGKLYATEHGPSGLPPDCCRDEVNRIEPGKNYGWGQTIWLLGKGGSRSGKLGRPGLEDPIAESGPRDTWAPAGAAIVRDTLFFGGLRGEALFAIPLRHPVEVRRHFVGQFGRIREVVRGPDGFLFLTTSNRDGRGRPRPGDDRILRIDPARL